ncbi:hypothetical protein D3C87_1738280 [compost metagenome]
MKVLFLPTEVMLQIGGGMIGFLIHQHAIQPQRFQFGILFLRQRLNLHHQRTEMAADRRNMLAKVIHADLGLVFTGDQQQMLKTQSFNRQTLAFDFCGIQGFALDAIAH